MEPDPSSTSIVGASSGRSVPSCAYAGVSGSTARTAENAAARTAITIPAGLVVLVVVVHPERANDPPMIGGECSQRK
jgi:hypothetical protein